MWDMITSSVHKKCVCTFWSNFPAKWISCCTWPDRARSWLPWRSCTTTAKKCLEEEEGRGDVQQSGVCDCVIVACFKVRGPGLFYLGRSQWHVLQEPVCRPVVKVTARLADGRTSVQAATSSGAWTQLYHGLNTGWEVAHWDVCVYSGDMRAVAIGTLQWWRAYSNICLHLSHNVYVRNDSVYYVWYFSAVQCNYMNFKVVVKY